MSIKEKFVADVEEFMRLHFMPPTTFSLKFGYSPNFIERLRGGMSPTGKTMDDIYAQMKAYIDERARIAQGL